MDAPERPIAPLISSLVDAAHDSHAERKLRHPLTQQYAMFEWQLQEAATERLQQTRSRRKTEDNMSLLRSINVGRLSGGGGAQPRNRRQTETDLSYSAGSGIVTSGARGPRARQSSSGLSFSCFDPDEGGDPTCNLEVRRK